jgi:hypothetical protein
MQKMALSQWEITEMDDLSFGKGSEILVLLPGLGDGSWIQPKNHIRRGIFKSSVFSTCF